MRPEGPTFEARSSESGKGVLGEGAASPSPPVKGSGERYKLPQWKILNLMHFGTLS